MTKLLKIRKANLQDLFQAERIYRSSKANAQWLSANEQAVADFDSDTAGEDVFVAIDAERVVMGFVAVWTPESFIHHLYVDARFRRRGIGSSLLASLATWLPTPWKLKCITANHAAFAFYASLGWLPMSTGNGPDGEYQVMCYSP